MTPKFKKEYVATAAIAIVHNIPEEDLQKYPSIKYKIDNLPDNSYVVIAGWDHATCISTARLFGLEVKGCKQGFITNHKRFIERKEAMTMHKQTHPETLGDMLFSEDLNFDSY